MSEGALTGGLIGADGQGFLRRGYTTDDES